MPESVPPEVERLLTSEPRVAHLATTRENRPHVAPLWYRYEDGVIEVLTTGRILENVSANPRVALSIQDDDDGIPNWVVTVRGHATVVEDEEVAREHNRKLNRKYGVDEDSWSENTLVRITVGSTSYRQY